PVRGVLLDLGGVVYVGDTPIGGALSAVARLREAELPLRFVTNTTRRSRRQVIADLQRMGLRISDDELLNRAYRKITEGAALLALAMNRNFKDADGELSFDAGPFVAALEYASKRKAVLLGKPSAEFYQL